MFGFLIGTACLIGLIKVARHGGGYGCGSRHGSCDSGYRSGCGGGGDYRDEEGGPWGRHGGHGRHGGFGPRMFLRAAFERLDTTPGQEKVIVQAMDELREIFGKARGEFKGTRADFANVIRSSALDEASVASIFTKHDATLSETRRAAVESLRKIHDALTEAQREQVAEFIEKGPPFGRGGFRGRGGRWGGGPYRSSWV